MGVIALLSDMGSNDTGVAKTKSTLLAKLPHMQLVDVTHSITPYFIQQAAYLLSSSVRDFPAGSYHVLLYDLHYGPKLNMLLADWNGRKILAPDNGVLPLAFPGDDISTRQCFSMDDTGNRADWMQATADIIYRLENNPAEGTNYPIYEATNAAGQFQSFITPNSIEGHVIHIDNFGNVVLNITREEFESAGAGRKFNVHFVRENVSSISNHYNSVNRGEKLCRFNSGGYMEIAINGGNAAELFGLKLKRPQQLVYSSIKIEFE